MGSTPLKPGENYPGEEVLEMGHGGHFRGCLPPSELLLCSRIDIRVFGEGGDVNVMLWAPVSGRLSSAAVCKDLCFSRTLRGRQGRDAQPYFHVCKLRLRQAKGTGIFYQEQRKKKRKFSCCTLQKVAYDLI